MINGKGVQRELSGGGGGDGGGGCYIDLLNCPGGNAGVIWMITIFCTSLRRSYLDLAVNFGFN